MTPTATTPGWIPQPAPNNWGHAAPLLHWNPRTSTVTVNAYLAELNALAQKPTDYGVIRSLEAYTTRTQKDKGVIPCLVGVSPYFAYIISSLNAINPRIEGGAEGGA